MLRRLERTVIAGLAATRLIRAWKYEAIGEKPREAVDEFLSKPVYANTHTDEIDVAATSRREWARELLDCPHCLGFWLTLGCVIGYRFRPVRPLLEGLAGAMVLSWFVQWYPGFDFEEPDDPVLIVKDGGTEMPEGEATDQ